MSFPAKGILIINGWAGRREIPVLIVGETPKRYRIQAIQPIKLVGRYIESGETNLVPQNAIDFECEVCGAFIGCFPSLCPSCEDDCIGDITCSKQHGGAR